MVTIIESINLAKNYHVNTLQSIFSPGDSNGVNMLQINVRGINQISKLDSLCVFLQSLPVNVDVLIIGETWIIKDRCKYYNIPEFKSTYSSRNKSSGELAVFVRNELNFEVKSNLAEDGLHHIELSITTARITVHGIYRPPGYELEKFLSLVENIVSSSDPNTPCSILGDMNLAINDAESRGVQKYLQLLESYNMVVTNTYCTRPVSDNILDHVVCLADISEQITNYTMDCNLSDHSYVMTHFETSVNRVHQTLNKSIINHRQLSMHFQAFLETHDFSCLQPNEQLLAITSHFTRLKDSFTKKITVNVKMKKNVCPWFNFDIWKLSRISNNLYRRWKVNREDQRMKDLLNHANKRLAKATK